MQFRPLPLSVAGFVLLTGLIGLGNAAPLKKTSSASDKGKAPLNLDIDQAMSRVIRGEDVKSASDWQFVVDLSQAKDAVSKSRFCTGTLIRENVVLTAAHCVLNNGDMGDGTFATAGRINLQDEHADNNGSKTLRAVAAVAHPEYAGLGSPKDVALLLLEGSVKKKVVKLADATPSEGTETTVVGYGLSVLGTIEATHNAVEVMPSKLQMTKLRIEKREFCDESRPGMSSPLSSEEQGAPKTAEGMLCTSGIKHGSSACRGDSGGGLFALKTKDGKKEAVQVGIVSYGDAQCMSEDSGVFTDVSSVREWIDHTADRLNDIKNGGSSTKSEGKDDKKKDNAKKESTKAPTTSTAKSSTSTEETTTSTSIETTTTSTEETTKDSSTTADGDTSGSKAGKEESTGDSMAPAPEVSERFRKDKKSDPDEEGIIPIGFGEVISVRTSSKAPYTERGRYLSFVRVSGGAGRRVEAFACVEKGTRKPRMFLVGDETARNVKEEVGEPGKEGCTVDHMMVRVSFVTGGDEKHILGLAYSDTHGGKSGNVLSVKLHAVKDGCKRS